MEHYTTGFSGSSMLKKPEIWRDKARLGCQGEKRLHGGLSRDEGHELGEDDLHLVHLLAHKLGEQLICNRLRLLCGGRLPRLKARCKAGRTVISV